jgi:hypothetical protein
MDGDQNIYVHVCKYKNISSNIKKLKDFIS